jgi:hypothetical protein
LDDFFFDKTPSNEAVILNVILSIRDKPFKGESEGCFIETVFEMKILIITAYVMFKEI